MRLSKQQILNSANIVGPYQPHSIERDNQNNTRAHLNNQSEEKNWRTSSNYSKQRPETFDN